MLQSHIIITQTHIDQDIIRRIIGQLFLKTKNVSRSIDLLSKVKKTTEGFEIDGTEYNTEDVYASYQAILSARKIIERDYTDKKNFTENILDLYETYSEPTILFLGDLDVYSTALQEGMLRLLEEPPKNLFVVLFARTKSGILSTIKSRCQFHTLTKSLVIQILNQKLLERTKKNLPNPGDFSKSLIGNTKNIEIPDLKKVDRVELDFWLWQISSYLQEFYKQNQDQKIADGIKMVLESQKLNNSNLQKKFVVGWLRK